MDGAAWAGADRVPVRKAYKMYVGGAFVRLLDSTDEFTAEVVASATGDFRFFAAPGTWTLRALSPAGNGDASVAPSGAGIHEVDVKVA